jgi:hypothetical protein
MGPSGRTGRLVSGWRQWMLCLRVGPRRFWQAGPPIVTREGLPARVKLDTRGRAT